MLFRSSWELDVWGKLNRQSRARYASFLASHSYKNLVQTSLIANIATSYYSLLALDEQLEVTESIISILKESEQTMQSMKDAGMLNQAAVEQSRSLLFRTQASIFDLKIQIRKIENMLSTLVGRNPGSIERTSIKDQSVPKELHYGIPAQMLARRPDVQQAELAFRSAFELTNAAQASFYPSITLSSSSMLGYAATDMSEIFKPANIFANIIGGLTQPIFARKQLTGNLKIAKAQQEEALLTFQKTVLVAGQEVSDILFAFDVSVKRDVIRSAQLDATEKSVEYTLELLKAGEANYTEVLTAGQNLLTAHLNQVSDKLEQLQYSVNLYKALGGGSSN